MSSTGLSNHLRRVLLLDEVSPSWFAIIVPLEKSSFVHVIKLFRSHSTVESAAIDAVEHWTSRCRVFRVWVWRGLGGRKTTVVVTRTADKSLSFEIPEDQSEHA